LIHGLKEAIRKRSEEGRVTTASQSDTTQVKVLGDGNRIPLLGLGVWQVPDGEECVRAVREALEAGYRHIDTAQAYGNEASVGRALRESGVARDEVFVTTKFNPNGADPAAEAERSRERLGVETIDLYIIHWPQSGPTWAWPGMERARELGYARSIGVSNFSVRELEQLLEVATVPPAINQVQLSPFSYRRALLDAGAAAGIAFEAYSPLGTGRHLADVTVAGVAERVGRTPAQVLLRWALQRDLVVLPKSVHRERIEENARIFDFELSEADMAALDALDRTSGASIAREIRWWR
jgi:diketogulonate reductase-like aldo/keto reductase